MPQNKKCEPQQYQARAILGVMPDIAKREVAIAFKGEESEENFDLAVILPAGAVAFLTVALQEACAKIDAQVADKSVAMQALSISGAQAANPILGNCAIVLGVPGFQLPAVLSKKAALQTITALEQAIASLDGPSAKEKLS